MGSVEGPFINVLISAGVCAGSILAVNDSPTVLNIVPMVFSALSLIITVVTTVYTIYMGPTSPHESVEAVPRKYVQQE